MKKRKKKKRCKGKRQTSKKIMWGRSKERKKAKSRKSNASRLG